MSVEAIIAIIMGVLPSVMTTIQDILKAVQGGQPVTQAHLDALKDSLDEVHAQVSAAVKPQP